MYSHSLAESGVSYSDAAFSSYLSRSKENIFSFDLSNSPVLEIIKTLIRVKSKMSPNYGKSFSTLVYHLRNLESDFNCKIMPTQVTDIFWHNFVPYLIDKGLALSSIRKVCSQLCTSLNWGSKYGAKITPTYDLMDIPTYSKEQIALTPDEVSHIYHFDLSTIKRRKQHLRKLEEVRDMFVLSCNLGQRFSDMVRINKTCFNRHIFTIVQQKTGVSARVDIDKLSIDRNTTYAILEKYNYNSPLTTDISCYNKYLKELLQYIGFKELIKSETKINGRIEVSYEPKWKLVGSHTARRTFATNNVLRGFKNAEIRRATGHKSESAFERYICYFDE